MTLNELLKSEDIDPEHVFILRHSPHEPELRKVLPWLAAEKHEVFNAYQQTHGVTLEKAMTKLAGSGYIASFIGHEPERALFIGIYAIGNTKHLTREEYWRVPAYTEMKALGMKGITGEVSRTSIVWFDLKRTEHYAHWKGKLVIRWPPKGRLWWRRAHRSDMPVHAILETSALDAAMPHWTELTLSWEELALLPSPWKAALSQWRGIYHIFDTADAKGYVGSAYGKDNLYGRWLNYAAQGHGGNKLLRGRDPKNFRFSILQRVSPDMDPQDIIPLENSWKQRLHTRNPYGLNEN